MHAVTRDHPLPDLPMSTGMPSSNTSSVWRHRHSTMSSPAFSGSKIEEYMDIDQYENNPPTGSFLQQSSALLSCHGRRSLFSLSDLHISEQNNKPLSTFEKAASVKRQHSFQLLSAEINLQRSSSVAYSARNSVCTLTSESDDSDCHLSDVTMLSSPDTTGELECSQSLGTTGADQSSLAPLNKPNSGSQTRSMSSAASVPQGQKKLLFTGKSFLFSVAFVFITVAVCISFVQHSPTTDCTDQIDVDSLRRELHCRIFGQHIAVNVIVKSLEEFTTAPDRRQLVMSFHGWTGIGKNFVSRIIAEHLSPTNVHKIIVPLHFAHASDNDGLLLSEWILSNVSSPSCGLHLFIIDEIDKAASSLIYSFHETLSKLSEQSCTTCRAVFLLLTNDGATGINAAITELLKNGGSREDLDHVNLVADLTSQWYTELVSSTSIDEVVPFLPLERQHVAQCVETELKQRQVDITQRLVDDVVNSLSYFPAASSFFSSSGCRRISQLVDLFL